MKEYVLVIELTTVAIHSRLVSTSGTIVHSSTRPLETILPSPERPYIVELDPARLWSSIRSTVTDCVKRAKGGRILAITTAGQRFTTAMINDEGGTSVLCPNMDARGAEVEDLAIGTLGEKAYQITGLHPSFLFSFDRLRWFMSNYPKVIEGMKYLATIDGWIYFKLTGAPAEEPSQAAGTFLFDIRSRHWSQEMCSVAHIDPSKLPNVSAFGELVGYPTEKLQASTGISPRTQVIMGAGDTHCSGIGSSALSPGQAYVSLGSTAPLHVVMSDPRIDQEKRMWTGCFPVDGQWVLESNSGVCGTVFDWLATSVLQIMRRGRSDYRRFDRLAKSASRGSGDVAAFLGPSIMDARAFTQVSPAAIVMPSLVAGRRPAAPEIARACYEDIAFACKGNLEQMNEVWHEIEPNFRAAGGLSNSEVLIQILADVLSRAIVIPVERRASAIGASVACWSFLRSEKPVDVVKDIVKKKVVTPSQESDAYQADYRRWRLIYSRLGSLV